MVVLGSANSKRLASSQGDRAGNMTTVPKPSSLANGLTLKFDAWNRVVEIKDGATVVGKYEYDAIGRRVKRHIDSQSPQPGPNGIDRYEHLFYGGAQVIETRGTTAISDHAENVQPKYQYVWSRLYIDAPVLRDENTDTDNLCDDARVYFFGDANMNVTSLVDTAGDALERYVYDPYGRLTIYNATWSNTRGTSSYSNTTLYTGRDLDPESGLYFYRARYYSAELGRFLSRDPIGYQHGGKNLYLYGAGTPGLLADPLGLEPHTPGHWGSPSCKVGWLPRAALFSKSKVTGPCYIHIYAGHYGPDADAFYKKHRGPMATYYGCGPYLGFITCWSEKMQFKVHRDKQIPDFPTTPVVLLAINVLAMIKDAVERINAFVETLCANRKKFCDDGMPERYACGLGDQRCDSVTGTVTCDAAMRKLLTKGVGPSGEKVLNPTRETKSFCGWQKTVICPPPGVGAGGGNNR